MLDASHPSEIPFLPWRAEYAIGIHRFDEEHARLAALISHLHTTMILRRDKELSLKVLQRLTKEARSHFDAEEALMQDLGYPDLPSHSAEHARLVDESMEMARQYQLGNISALALPGSLRKWLLHHIATCDKAYTDFMKTHGVP